MKSATRKIPVAALFRLPAAAIAGARSNDQAIWPDKIDDDWIQRNQQLIAMHCIAIAALCFAAILCKQRAAEQYTCNTEIGPRGPVAVN